MKNNIHSKPFWSTFLVAVMLMVISISMVSAVDWNNVIDYKDDDMTVVLTNWWDIPFIGDKLGEATLASHTTVNEIKEVGIGDVVTMYYDFVWTGDEGDLGNVYFTDMNAGGKEIEKDYHFVVANYIEVPTYTYGKEICEDIISLNLSSERVCSKEIISTTYNKEIGSWSNLEGLKIPKGNITIGLMTTTKEGDLIDGVWEIAGKLVEKHAVWDASLTNGLEAYYKFDEGVGVVAGDSANSSNGTLTGGTTWTGSGKLGTDSVTFAENGGDSVTLPLDVMYSVTDYTISCWIKGTTGNADGVFINRGDSTFVGGIEANEKFWYHTSTGNCDVGTILLFDGNWNHWVWRVIRATSNATGYVNGAVDFSVIDSGVQTTWENTVNLTFGAPSWASPDAGLSMDECGLWNRALTEIEITDLYNSGNGLPVVPDPISPIIQINLNSPANAASNISGGSFYFNATLVPVNIDLKNATLTIWDSDDAVFNSTINESSLDASNSTNWKTTFNTVGDYKWGVYGCGENSTSSICNWSANRTFSIVPYTTTSETFSTTTTEGSTENFELNISLSIGRQVSTANLYYNNTAYSGILKAANTTFTSISRTLVIPNVKSQTNNSLFWSITLDDSSQANTTAQSQIVNNLTLDGCSANTNVLYNFSIVDEKTQQSFNADTYNASGKINVQLYNLERTNSIGNFTATNNNSNNFSVCISSNLNDSSEFSLDLQVNYDAGGYASEYYHIQNATISNSSFNTKIILYDLEDDESQEFVITYKDSSFRAVSNALIQIQRKYIDEGVFKTVEIPRTDDDGETVAHLELADAIYTFVVVKNGVVLGTFENVLAVCQDIVLGNCDIKLNEVSTTSQTDDFTVLDDLTITLTYDQDTRELQSIFTVPSGTPKTLKLNATLYDNIGETEVCSDVLLSSSGTLTCTAPQNFGNGTMIVTVTANDETQAHVFVKMQNTSKDVYGSSIIFLTLFLYLSLIGVGVSDNPMVTGFFLLIGAILAIGLNLTNTTKFFGTGATILWLFIIIVIIMMKGAKRS